MPVPPDKAKLQYINQTLYVTPGVQTPFIHLVDTYVSTSCQNTNCFDLYVKSSILYAEDLLGNKTMLASTGTVLYGPTGPQGVSKGQILYLNKSQYPSPAIAEYSLLSLTNSDSSGSSDTKVLAGNKTSFVVGFANTLDKLNIGNFFPSGFWDVNIFAAVDTGATAGGKRYVSLNFAVYGIRENGTETQITVNSDEEAILTNSVAQYSLSLFVPYNDLSLYKSIVIKIFATNTHNQSHTLNLWYEGSANYSHIHTPLSILPQIGPTGPTGPGTFISGTPSSILYFVNSNIGVTGTSDMSFAPNTNTLTLNGVGGAISPPYYPGTTLYYQTVNGSGTSPGVTTADFAPSSDGSWINVNSAIKCLYTIIPKLVVEAFTNLVNGTLVGSGSISAVITCYLQVFPTQGGVTLSQISFKTTSGNYTISLSGDFANYPTGNGTTLTISSPSDTQFTSNPTTSGFGARYYIQVARTESQLLFYGGSSPNSISLLHTVSNITPLNEIIIGLAAPANYGSSEIQSLTISALSGIQTGFTTLQVNGPQVINNTFQGISLSVVGDANFTGNIAVSSIGVGVSNSPYLFDVGGNGYNSGITTTKLLLSNGTSQILSNNTTTYTARITGGLLATYFGSVSDERIKTNISTLDNGIALNELRSIQPKMYNYIDWRNRGNRPVFGFIAQQVAQSTPTAVSIVPDFIPNIYSHIQVSSFVLTNEKYSILNIPLFSTNTILSSCNLSSILSIIFADNTNVQGEVISKTDEHIKIKINTNCSKYLSLSNTIFIYGELIPDFYTLNKDYLYTINFAATKDLDFIIHNQSTQISELRHIIQQQQETISTVSGLFYSTYR